MRSILTAIAITTAASSAGAQDFFGQHPPGYIPLTVPSQARIVVPEPDRFQRRDRFEIYVTPNIVPEEQATAQAASVAARHCAARSGRPLATIDGVHRYTELRLESWGFEGYCR